MLDACNFRSWKHESQQEMAEQLAIYTAYLVETHRADDEHADAAAQAHLGATNRELTSEFASVNNGSDLAPSNRT